MARRVEFVDTSVLCNLLGIPGKSQDRAEVIAAYQVKQKARDCDLLLPVTAIIETGNHIAQLADGRQRRACAELFDAMLRAVVNGDAPWALNEVEWNAAHLDALLAGGRTGSTLVEHACNRLGCGDLNILIERDRYLARTSGVQATVWTLDELLSSYA
ncbi:hypothetical protein [Actinacidiphila acidipaludis]|uniref:PIN domain-containing protein n=1 Tax=Actinacidiphila acidipaludis TaxID=2873382 RepID=A0ABS7QBD6_9ACTN|nr:hypothetical protein [Streptomyces acidipaludis]MBY8880446.1 hypothetical protein [Streptomyces acidipaludis]